MRHVSPGVEARTTRWLFAPDQHLAEVCKRIQLFVSPNVQLSIDQHQPILINSNFNKKIKKTKPIRKIRLVWNYLGHSQLRTGSSSDLSGISPGCCLFWNWTTIIFLVHTQLLSMANLDSDVKLLHWRLPPLITGREKFLCSRTGFRPLSEVHTARSIFIAVICFSFHCLELYQTVLSGCWPLSLLIHNSRPPPSSFAVPRTSYVIL